VPGYTENFDMLINLRVTGLETISQIEQRLQQLGRNTERFGQARQTVGGASGGTLDPVAQQQQLAALFRQNGREQAAFAVGVQNAARGTDFALRASLDRAKAVQQVFREIGALQSLQGRKTLADFGFARTGTAGAATTQLRNLVAQATGAQNIGSVGTIAQNPAGKGFVVTSATGDPLGTATTRVIAAQKILADLINRSAQRLEQLGAEEIGGISNTALQTQRPAIGRAGYDLSNIDQGMRAAVQKWANALERQGKVIDSVTKGAGGALIKFTDTVKGVTGEVLVNETGIPFNRGTQPITPPGVQAPPSTAVSGRSLASEVRSVAQESNRAMLEAIGSKFGISLENALGKAGYARAQTGVLTAGDLKRIPSEVSDYLLASQTARARGQVEPFPLQGVPSQTQYPIAGLARPTVPEPGQYTAQEAEAVKAQASRAAAGSDEDLVAANRRLTEQLQRRVDAERDATSAARAAEAASRAYAAAEEKNALAQQQAGRAEKFAREQFGSLNQSQFAPPQVPGLTTLYKTDQAGQISGVRQDYGNVQELTPAALLKRQEENYREQQRLQSAQVRLKSYEVEQDAINRLGGSIFRGGTPESGRLPAGQVAQAYVDALQAAQPSLDQAGIYDETAKKVERLQFAATEGAVAVDKMSRRATQFSERDAITNRFSQGGLIGQGAGNFFADLRQGFRGRRELPYGEQIGQVAKFSLLYGTAYQAIYALGQGMRTAVDEAVKYNAALVDLAIATNSSKESVSGLASGLSRIATGYGLSPSAGIEVGTRAVGIFDLNSAAPNVRDYETRSFTRAVSQLQFVTGRDVEQITEDVGSIAQAFGLAASQASQVQDLDAFFSRRFGSALGGTLESVAQIGSIASDAGFTIEEVSALASKLQSRTGQTPQAVAGLLSQFLGRSGDPALQGKLAQLGVNTAQPFKDQIAELSQAELSQSQRLFIENAFGRGRSGQAASIITQDFGEIQAAAQEAQTGAVGLGAKQLGERMNTVAGQAAKLSGDLRSLSVAFGQSGILDILLVAAKALDSFVVGLTNILDVWNLLPRAIKDAIIGLGALAAATKFAAGTETVKNASASAGGFLNFLRSGGAAAAAAAPAAAGVSPGQLALFSAKSVGGASGVGGLVAGASAASKALTGMSLTALGTTVGVAALGLAAAEFYSQWKENNTILADARASLASNLAGATTSTDLLTAASSLREQAKIADTGQGFILNAGTLGGAERSADKLVGTLRAFADFAEEAGKAKKAEEDLGAALQKTTVFGDAATITNDDIGKGLQTLTQEGVGATRQFNLLSKALRESGAAAAVYNPEAAAQQFTLDIGAAAGLLSGEREPLVTGETTGLTTLQPIRGEVAPLTGSKLVGGKGYLPSVDVDVTGEQAATAVLEGLPQPEDIQKKFLEKFGEKLPSGKGVRKFIANDLLANVDFGGVEGVDPGEYKKAVVDRLISGLQDFFNKTDPNRLLTNQELTQFVNGAGDNPGRRAQGDASLARLEELGYGPGSEKYQAQANRVAANLRAQTERAQTGKGPQALRDAIRIADDRIIQGAISRLEGIRAFKEAEAKGDKAIAAIRKLFGQRELNQVVGKGGRLKTTNLSIIEDVISRATTAQINVVRDAIREAIAAVRVKIQADRAVVAAVDAFDGRLGRIIKGIDEGYAAAKAALETHKKRLSRLFARLGLIDEAIGNIGIGSEYYGDAGSAADSGGPTDTAAQIAAAKAIAEAARRGGDILQAQAQLQSAKADLAAAEKGTVAYYQALAGVYEAQQALAAAIRAYKVNQFLARNDTTDPVIQARAQLIAARKQLAADQARGAGADLILQDKLDVRTEEANVQAAKFQQWFSDLQTAENLERITHAAYIRHLENRRNRLQAIKHRTRQEQEELDQVEGALKEAQRALSGQFNIGDIKIPTPYEVRRYIEQTSQNAKDAAVQRSTADLAANASQGGNTTVNRITIDGADTAQIERILNRILGGNAIKTTSTATGKR
jgi:hypothetical protein